MLYLILAFFSLQSHLAQTQTDGRRVQEFVQNIHPTQPIIRNDFSHLGIMGLHDQDLSDNISVASFSATASVPYAQVIKIHYVA